MGPPYLELCYVVVSYLVLSHHPLCPALAAWLQVATTWLAFMVFFLPRQDMEARLGGCTALLSPALASAIPCLVQYTHLAPGSHDGPGTAHASRSAPNHVDLRCFLRCRRRDGTFPCHGCHPVCGAGSHARQLVRHR